MIRIETPPNLSMDPKGLVWDEKRIPIAYLPDLATVYVGRRGGFHKDLPSLHPEIEGFLSETNDRGFSDQTIQRVLNHRLVPGSVNVETGQIVWFQPIPSEQAIDDAIRDQLRLPDNQSLEYEPWTFSKQKKFAAGEVQILLPDKWDENSGEFINSRWPFVWAYDPDVGENTIYVGRRGDYHVNVPDRHPTFPRGLDPYDVPCGYVNQLPNGEFNAKWYEDAILREMIDEEKGDPSTIESVLRAVEQTLRAHSEANVNEIRQRVRGLRDVEPGDSEEFGDPGWDLE